MGETVEQAHERGEADDQHRVTDEAARRAEAMLDGARRGRPVTAAVRHGPSDLHHPALGAAVTTQLRTALVRAVAAAWPRGWQPADVVHASRRSLTAGQVGAVVRGVREELATYARTTVDPRWWEQLDGLVDVAPAAGRRAGGRRDLDPPDGSPEEHAALVGATVFLERLPPLQVLGPLPGQARHDDQPPTDVDDKLLTRVRRFLAQAEGTPYEEEAETFTAAAQSLMTRHRIDRAMLEAGDEQTRTRFGPGAVRLTVDRPYEQPKMLLLHVIAAANRCRALWNQPVGFATVVGHPADRRAVELLFTSLLVQATTAMHRESQARGGAARTRGFRSSFLSGFAARIGQRLDEASRATEDDVRTRVDAASADAPTDGAPRGAAAGDDRLALVLRRRDEEVEQLVRDLFPHTVRSRSRTISDHAGWMHGRAAADRASLGVGERLTGGTSRRRPA